jgi:hypothetical protein
MVTECRKQSFMLSKELYTNAKHKTMLFTLVHNLPLIYHQQIFRDERHFFHLKISTQNMGGKIKFKKTYLNDLLNWKTVGS